MNVDEQQYCPTFSLLSQKLPHFLRCYCCCFLFQIVLAKTHTFSADRCGFSSTGQNLLTGRSLKLYAVSSKAKQECPCAAETSNVELLKVIGAHLDSCYKTCVHY